MLLSPPLIYSFCIHHCTEPPVVSICIELFMLCFQIALLLFMIDRSGPMGLYLPINICFFCRYEIWHLLREWFMIQLHAYHLSRCVWAWVCVCLIPCLTMSDEDYYYSFQGRVCMRVQPLGFHIGLHIFLCVIRNWAE